MRLDGMAFLILAIVSSTINHLLFKPFARHRIDLSCVLTINYAVCVGIGCAASSGSFVGAAVLTQAWFPISLLQGTLFVICFFLLGWTTQKRGVAVASLATRLSVAIPTMAGCMATSCAGACSGPSQSAKGSSSLSQKSW